MKKDKVIYRLVVEDVLNVIEENEMHIQLSEQDVDFIEAKIGNYIDWYGAIENVLNDLEESKNSKFDMKQMK